MRAALLIATTRYDDGTLSSLNAPAADVAALEGLLHRDDVCGFSDVRAVLNGNESEIRKAIGRFFQHRQRADVLVLYYSGHGMLDREGRLYLSASDTDRELLAATATPATFIRESMDACRSTRQILVLDCCHAGAFGRGAKGTSINVGSKFEGDGSARVILTATDATQFAWEGDQIIGDARCSAFTHFLVEGLETGAADENGSGEITVDELFHYASRCIREHGAAQTPQMWTFGQTGRIVVAKRVGHLVVAVPADIVEDARSGNERHRWAVLPTLAGLLASDHVDTAYGARTLLVVLLDDPSARVAQGAAEILESWLSHTDGAANARQGTQTLARTIELVKAQRTPTDEAQLLVSPSADVRPAALVADARSDQERHRWAVLPTLERLLHEGADARRASEAHDLLLGLLDDRSRRVAHGAEQILERWALHNGDDDCALRARRLPTRAADSVRPSCAARPEDTGRQPAQSSRRGVAAARTRTHSVLSELARGCTLIVAGLVVSLIVGQPWKSAVRPPMVDRLYAVPESRPAASAPAPAASPTPETAAAAQQTPWQARRPEALSVQAAHDLPAASSETTPVVSAVPESAVRSARVRSKPYDTLIEEAQAAYERGDLARAHAAFVAAHRVFPNARPLRALGVTSLELKQYSKAAYYLSASLAATQLPLSGELRDQTERLLERARRSEAAATIADQ